MLLHHPCIYLNLMPTFRCPLLWLKLVRHAPAIQTNKTSRDGGSRQVPASRDQDEVSERLNVWNSAIAHAQPTCWFPHASSSANAFCLLHDHYTHEGHHCYSKLLVKKAVNLISTDCKSGLVENLAWERGNVSLSLPGRYSWVNKSINT